MKERGVRLVNISISLHFPGGGEIIQSLVSPWARREGVSDFYRLKTTPFQLLLFEPEPCSLLTTMVVPLQDKGLPTLFLSILGNIYEK
uniref:SFRICE_024913 n=1 Tax=Spodoptera frugiperda TaxID=7108 RepID=A0A2H1X331_SPOFR